MAKVVLMKDQEKTRTKSTCGNPFLLLLAPSELAPDVFCGVSLFIARGQRHHGTQDVMMHAITSCINLSFSP